MRLALSEMNQDTWVFHDLERTGDSSATIDPKYMGFSQAASTPGVASTMWGP